MLPTRIDVLPDLCLMAIFDHVPLASVPSVLQTCHRWYAFKRYIYRHRHSVQLFVNELTEETDASLDDLHHQQQSSFNRLRFGTLTAGQVRWLLSSLTGINFLEVIIEGELTEQTAEQLSRLFWGLGDWLVILHLTNRMLYDHEYHPMALRLLMERVVYSLNHLHRLRQLNLCLRVRCLVLEWTGPVGGVLSRLRRLAIRIYNYNLCDLLLWLSRHLGLEDQGKLSPPSPLEEVELLVDGRHGEHQTEPEAIEYCFRMDPRLQPSAVRWLASRFVTTDQSSPFTFDSSFTLDRLDQFCDHFHRLSSVWLNGCEVSLAAASRCLVKLPELTTLWLGPSQYRSTDGFDDEATDELSPLPKVTWLSFTLNQEWWRDEVLSAMSTVPHHQVFPALQTLAFQITTTANDVDKLEENGIVLGSLELPPKLEPYLRCFFPADHLDTVALIDGYDGKSEMYWLVQFTPDKSIES